MMGDETSIFLRNAQKEDILLLFCWVNDPIVRQSAFCTENITFRSHKQWFLQSLNSDVRQIFILQKGELPIGQVRLEQKNHEWFIDYSIDAAWRGRGYGTKILQLIEEKLSKGTVLVAEVKNTNIPSQKVFESLGYERMYNKRDNIMTYKKYISSTRGGYMYI